MDNLKIKDVPFKEVMRDITGPQATQYMVMSYNINPSTGELEEDNMLPTVYKKYSSKERRQGKSRDPYQKLGHDNQYPFFLLDLLTKSPTHRKAWRVTSNVAYGEGWTATNAEGQDFLAWLQDKGLNYKFTKAALEQITAFGGVYVNMNFIPQLKAGGTSMTLDTLRTTKFTDVRIGKEEEAGKYLGSVQYYWYHPAFNSTKNVHKKFLRGVPKYIGFDDVQEGKRIIVQADKKKPYFEKRLAANKNKYMHLIGEPSITNKYYPSAPYETDAVIDSILLEAALSAFDVAGLKNGLMAGYIVTVPLADTSRRNPELFKKAKSDAKKLIEDKLKGAENNQRTIIVFQDPKDKAEGIKIATIPHTNTSGMHKMMDDRKRQIILSGWGVPDARLLGTPLLSGTGFSNQSEVLRTSEQLWYLLSIYPDSVVPLESFVEDTLKPLYIQEGGNPNAKVGLKRKTIFNEEPTDDILFSDFTREERRKRYGADPLTKEQLRVLNREVKQREGSSSTTTSESNLAKLTKENKALLDQMQLLLQEIRKNDE